MDTEVEVNRESEILSARWRKSFKYQTLKGDVWEEEWELSIGFNNVEVTCDHAEQFQKSGKGKNQREFKNKREENQRQWI